MDTIRDCFGSGNSYNTLRSDRRPEDDDDEDPLLPDSTPRVEPNGSTEPPATKFRKKNKGGRFIDLSESIGSSPSGQNREQDSSQGEESKTALDKIIDAVAALSTGKLPTQDQVTRILQVVLGSELLRPTAGDEGEGAGASSLNERARRSRVGDGTGPTSRKGRKVIEDVRNVVQAALQFGMEKNDDNTLQDLVYHLSLIEGNPIDELKDSVELPKPKVNVDISNAAESSKDAVRAGKEVAEDLKDKIPSSSEVSNDAAIFIHALRTLVQSVLTSSVFRYLLVDILSIFRDLVAHGASDISHAAAEVQKVAEGVEGNARNADIATKVDETFDSATLKDGGAGDHDSTTLGDVVNRVGETADDVKHMAEEKAGEWVDLGKEATDKAKTDLLERIQQVLVQVQEDPSSRQAMRAILILVRKYADKVAETADVAVESAEKVVDAAEDAAVNTVRGAGATVSFSEAHDSAHDVETAGYTYPPRTLYPPLKPDATKGQDTRATHDQEPFELALRDLKTLLERFAQGRSIDGLISKFGTVVKDLDHLPVEVGKTLDEEALLNSTESNASVDTLKPHGKGAKKQKHKKNRRRGGKSKTQGQGQPGGLEDGHEQEHEQDQGEMSTGEDEAEHRGEEPNVIRKFFVRLGEYLDRALDEPGWATSSSGQGEMEELFEQGVELLNVVGEVVVDVGEGVVSSGGAEDDHEEKERKTLMRNSSSTSRTPQDMTRELRRRFRNHVKEFMHELEGYVDAVEKDRSSMKLLKALDALGTSTSELFFGPSSGNKRSKRRPTLTKRLWSSLQWTEWVGWALPKILRMIPFDVVPIPSLEAKSESGGWEAGLYALFVKGSAAERQAELGARRQNEREVPRGGVQTTLVPDLVVFKEWTEVRIDMADEHADSGSLGYEVQPRVETTSRVRMHVDGVRAKVDGLGYYFRYGVGSWLGYEDEGVMNVDVGMGQAHGGFGCDVEIEVRGEHSAASSSDGHRVVSTPDILEAVVGEGVEGEGDVVTIPGIVEEESINWHVNGDVQTVLASKSAAPHARYAALMDELENAPLEPLFRVVDVNVQMRGVHVQLEKSRHWILNKLLVQPLAGPTVSEVVKYQMQEKIKEVLGVLAVGLARVARDAEAEKEKRKEDARKRRVKERQRRVSDLIRQGRYDDDYYHRLQELDEAEYVDDDDDDESFVLFLEDWWRALVKSGPTLLQGGKAQQDEDGEVTRTSFDATGKGVIYHQSTLSRTETRSSQPTATPAMVFNKREGSMEPVPNQESGHETEPTEAGGSDLTLAVGGGAQLFGDKQVPYGARNDQGEGVESEVQKLVSVVKGTADNVATEAMGTAVHVGTRWRSSRTAEEGQEDWHSSAFDV